MQRRQGCGYISSREAGSSLDHPYPWSCSWGGQWWADPVVDGTALIRMPPVHATDSLDLMPASTGYPPRCVGCLVDGKLRVKDREWSRAMRSFLPFMEVAMPGTSSALHALTVCRPGPPSGGTVGQPGVVTGQASARTSGSVQWPT